MKMRILLLETGDNLEGGSAHPHLSSRHLCMFTGSPPFWSFLALYGMVYYSVRLAKVM
jgi:hypothetical protein